MIPMPDSAPASTADERLLALQPARQVSVRDVFGVDSDMMVPAFDTADDHVPEIDPAYRFDPQTTLAICAGFAYDRRVMVQGYHGTGKSTHIEQIAARLNWPLVRVNLDAHYAHLLVHGTLHAQGHEHDGVPEAEAAAMEARETAILASLGVADPYQHSRR